MPTSAGPNSKGENSLVFAFDMADTRNSNLGEPTVNIRASSGLDGSYSASGRVIDNSGTLKAPDGSTGWSSISSPGSNADYRIAKFSYNTLTEGSTYTFSLELYNPGPNALEIFVDGNHGQPGTTIPLGYSRYSYTYTVTKVGGGTWAIFFGAENKQANVVYSSSRLIYFKNYQVEEKSHATPFVNGERTFYNSIKDLTKRTSIGANFVNFNSEGKILFDGTGTNNNLYVDSNNDDHLKLYGDHTIEAVINPYSEGWVDSTTSIIRFGMGADLLYAFQVANRNQLVYHWYDTGFRSVYSPEGIVNENEYNHVLVVKSGLTVTFYSNGVYSGKYAITQSTVNPGSIGIGATRHASVTGTNGQDFSGEIPVLKIYDKALLAEEVSANFKVIRKRFNI
jgi:hypothetical protein